LHSRRAIGVFALALLALVLAFGSAPLDIVPQAPSPSPAGSTAGRTEPIVVTRDDTTIVGVSLVGTGTGIGISAIGTTSKPIRNLTIRDCSVTGFETGIEVRHVVDLVIEGCTIEDSVYAGILVFSGLSGRISHNTIRRTGYYTPLDTSFENNAYGIALTRVANDDFATNPRTSDFLIEGNTVEDVPYWHCLDTHAGERITFKDNVTRRCPRAIFITTDGIGTQPTDVTIVANRLEEAIEVDGGTDAVAITLVNLKGGTIERNAVSASYPRPHVFDYLGLDPAGSSGVSVVGETVIE
jgi:hypothetical protein